MKLFFILLFLPAIGLAQPKLFSKKDIAPASLMFTAGHLNGWREEVLYHPNQLFARMPNLNRPFWDIREQNPPGFLNTEWDADHVLEAGSKAFMVAAVVIKIGEKKKWYWYFWDGFKYMAAFKTGEYFAYNIIHGNNIFK